MRSRREGSAVARRKWHGAAVAAGCLVLAATDAGPAGGSWAPPSGILWSAGMEAGSLAEWSAGEGGGLFNSGPGSAAVSSERAHTGIRSLRMTISAPPNRPAAVRAFRWAEASGHRDLFYSVWIYVPTHYTPTGDPDRGRFWNLFQFKSRSSDGRRDDPVWALYATPDAEGRLYLRAGWGWGGTALAGPFAGATTGGRFFEPFWRVPLPVGRWFQLQALYRPSADFDGRLVVWQDGLVLFNLNGIRTSYRNCGASPWCTSTEWSVNHYSDGLAPDPSTIYVDDAVISTRYVP